MGLKFIYREIFFSFIFRDEEYPAIVKSKGFSIKGAVRVIVECLRSDLHDLLAGDSKEPNGKIWLYAESINQFRALEFLSSLNSAVLVTNSDSLVTAFPNSNFHKLTFRHRIFQRLGWFRRYFIYKALFTDRFGQHFNTIFKNDGIYEDLCTILKRCRPAAIVMSNDINAMCRALLFAAKENGIPTVYLQHAAVTSRFPPLKFDLSLLDGKDSLDKYAEAGQVESRVEFVGIPRFDPYVCKIKNNTNVGVIGIALNKGDDFARYYTLAYLIQERFSDILVVFRFHPSIDVLTANLPKGFHLSSVVDESSFDFLGRIDVLLAGNSSIHLEAILMNVVSLCLDVGAEGSIEDYYGFVKNGLVERVSQSTIIEKIASLRHSRPNVRHRAKYYVDTLGTEWDGRSQEKVKAILGKYVSR